jgi:hypothetical protein
VTTDRCHGALHMPDTSISGGQRLMATRWNTTAQTNPTSNPARAAGKTRKQRAVFMCCLTNERDFPVPS